MVRRVVSDEEMREFLSGSRLVGNDFEGEELANWYRDEEVAYAEMYPAEFLELEAYKYHALNVRHGFSALDPRPIARALSLGGGSGAELAPVAERVGRIDVVDAAEAIPIELPAPVHLHRAPPEGVLPFPNSTFDLVTCFGVLHHIARVGDTLRELSRVCRDGARLLVREPIVSMGDWRRPRRGLTPRERGIPLPIFEELIQEAGLETLRARPCIFSVSSLLQGRMKRSLFDDPMLTRIDDWLARLTLWNWTYHANSLVRRFRPTSVFYVLEKPALGSAVKSGD